MTFFPIKSSEFGRVTPSAIAIAERFWKHVDKTPGHGPKGECWVWIGDRHPKGYGKMYFQFPRAVCRKKEKPFRAHRISWLLYRGLIPHHFHVLHHCDTPACVRPDHLFLGKDKDNGRHIPLIVENVRGAVKWVNQPVKWHFGSYYLLGMCRR